MGQCGCTEVKADWKIIDTAGNTWLFGVYPSCQDCQGPAAVMIHCVRPKDRHLYDVEDVPDFDLGPDGIAFIDVVSTDAVRDCMRRAIEGYRDLDAIDADTLACEAFPDLRDAVFATAKK